MNDIDSIKAGLATDDPTEFPKHVEELYEWLKTTNDPWRNQRAAGALLDVACSKERNLEVRLLAVNALPVIGDKVPEELKRLIGVCDEEDEPLRLRWAAVDLLQAFNPELIKMLIYHKDLFDRTIDPDNPPPKLNVSDEISKIAEKQKREMKFYPLIALMIFGGMMGTYFAFNTDYFRYVIAGWTALVIVSIILAVVMPRRCPKCRRFFARVKLECVDSYSGPSMPIGSLGTGGSPVHTSQRVNVYEVRCRFCKHPWVILR
ncbi:MAG: hypothetical protein MUD12_12670 [Spirochaetes bacterium]|jgi:hypothetical protein|nr:hypothetical protein [Spirochaetota bacterium]